MPKNDDKNFTITADDEKPEFIPVDDAMLAEWMKNPKFAEAYEALQPKYDKIRRQIKAKDARIAKRKAFVKRVRTFGATLMRGMNRIAY